MTPHNILIVDDDAGDRKLMRRLLLKLHPDARILEAENGAQALLYAGSPVEVAFIDYLLPDGTGIELIGQLAEVWPRAVAFVMTGQGDEEVAKSAILAGAADYIAKSAITAQALQRMIANGLNVAAMQWQIEEQQNELRLFSDVLVHDLRAPVRAIRFLSDQIMEDFGAGNLDAAAGGFDMMKKSVQKMSDLIEQLACHINPHSEGKPEVVPVESLYDGLRAVMAQDIAASGARVRWQSGGLQALCFPAEITQLLQNLIGNSIKYSGGGPPEIAVTAAPVPDGLQISVADNGLGVPAEYRKKIFEPFKRLQRTSGLPGTGLGLATCAKIAKRHNGEVWCDPEAAAGTTIHFTLRLENAS